MAGRHRSPARRKPTDDDDYAAMLLRLIGKYADRIQADPTAYVHVAEFKAAIAAMANVGLYGANQLADRPYGLNELAELAGIKKQSAHEQIKRGEITHAQLESARAAGIPRVRASDLRAARLARRELEAGSGET